MVPYIITLFYGILSVIVLLLMTKQTNQYIQEKKYIDENETVSLYEYNKVFYIGMFIIVTMSAACGYIISQRAVSILAVIELGTCYLAVLASAVIDYKLRVIPNYISGALVVLRIAIAIYEFVFIEEAISYMISSIIGLLFCVLFFTIASKLSKGGMGGGDVKLLCAVGFMCGVYVVFSSLFLALIICIIFNGILVLMKKQSSKGHIAFAPYIYAGFLVMCLFTLY